MGFIQADFSLNQLLSLTAEWVKFRIWEEIRTGCAQSTSY